MRPVLPRTDHNSWVCSAHSVKGAKFVAVRIPQIGEIESARGALTCPGRIFDRGAAVLHARFMPSIGLGGILHHEADRAGVGVGGRLMVDRLCDYEATAPDGHRQDAPSGPAGLAYRLLPKTARHRRLSSALCRCCR